MPDSNKLANSNLSKQELLEENQCLREKLAASEADSELDKELHKTLSRVMNVGYWEWDEITGRAAYFSEEMADILGMSLETLYEIYKCEEDFYRFVHPDDLQHYIDNLSAILAPDHQRGRAHVFDYRIIKPNGEVRHLLEMEYGVREEGGVITRSYGAIQDITDNEEAAQALKQSEQRYSALFSKLPLGVQEQDWSRIKLAVDKLRSEGVEDLKTYFKNNPIIFQELVGSIVITSVNDSLLEIYGARTLDELIEDEEDVTSWLDEEWAELYASEIAALAGPEKIHYAELNETRMDDSPFEVRLITSVVRGDEDSWKRILTIVEDVTERKKYEVNLIEARTEAEKASKAKSEFLSNMSHELRTPLNAILGFSQLFEYDSDLSEQRQSEARAINSAGQHLLNLIQEILDLSRIETGNLELSMEGVSLAETIEASVTWIEDMAKKRGISIEFDPAVYRGILIEADAIRLKQVFLNLLSNAVKYNREGGRINIDFSLDGQGIARIGITDTGPGISADRLGELFKPFNRLGAEFSAIEGTGIGLVITKQLVELMEGRLEVDSRAGEGTTFTVQFQVIQSDRHETLDSSAIVDVAVVDSGDSLKNRLHLLIAEDNPVNQQLIAAQLAVLGYSADYAENGVEALKLWKSGEYQLLLTDIRMPEMDGYELITQIRAMESKNEAMPIIAVTANAMESDVKQCFDTGANDVISKPFTLETLKQKLIKWTPFQQESQSHASLPVETCDISQGQPVDIEVLKQTIGDNIETHRRLLSAYVEALPEAVADIQRAFTSNYFDQLADHAHKLKSSSGSLGAMHLADTCRILELASREGQVSEIQSCVPRLTQYAEQVVEFVAELYPQSPLQVVDEPRVDSDEVVQEGGLSVLLVDDDSIMHRVTTLILNDLGINRVSNAMSGHEALKMLGENADSIDVIVCDLNMPEMDGIEFTRHLARQQYEGSLILSSGENIRILKTVEKLAIEHELQVLGVLEKPVTQAKLSDLLKELDQSKTDTTLIQSMAFSIEELTRAINEDELVVYFQPKVDVRSLQVVGVEALVRWNHPTEGLVGPFNFIPLVEKYNLIFELTQAVCKKSLRHAAQWQAMGFDLNLAINISVDALKHLDWPDDITTQVIAAGLKPESITLEITESQLIEHMVIALDILGRLSLKRFNLSIDDFGTGYSSMEQLQRIPFSELKIDRAFVRGASEDESARAILESSVLLAKKLDMKIVAEGVETKQDWNLVAELDCDQVQGYYIAKPMPADEFFYWLGTWDTKLADQDRR